MDGQYGEAVVASECTEDGIDLGVHETSPGDPGLEGYPGGPPPHLLQKCEGHSRHSG